MSALPAFPKSFTLHKIAELEALEYFEECVRNAAATASNGLASQKFSAFMTTKHHERLAELRGELATAQADAEQGQCELSLAGK